MATSELAVIDTNALVYAFDREAEHFEASRALVDAASRPDAGLLVTPQVIAEFLAVTTGSRVKAPLEPAQAAATLGALSCPPRYRDSHSRSWPCRRDSSNFSRGTRSAGSGFTTSTSQRR
jgi:predicted nucleic acid-binding protein